MGVSIIVPAAWGRSYFGVQAVAGAAWWIAVFASPFVRSATLGALDPVAVAVADIPLFVLASVLAAAGLRSAALVATGWTALVAVGLGAYATATGEAGWGVLIMLAAAGCSLVALSAMRLGRLPTGWIVSGPFGFRQAAPGRRRAALLLGTLGQLAVFWSFFLVLLPLAIVFLERRWALDIDLPPLVPLGAALLIAASALGLWAAVTMATLGGGTPLPAAMARRLVVAGPYRWVHNPMAVAGIAQGVAVGLLLPSWLVVGYALLGALVWNLLVRPAEEADLAERFGDAFQAYRAQVRCWLPRLTPWSASATSRSTTTSTSSPGVEPGVSSGSVTTSAPAASASDAKYPGASS